MRGFCGVVLLLCFLLLGVSQVVQANPIVPKIKIELNRDGLYEIDYAALASAEFPVDAVDPRNFTLSQRGQSVGYQFLGDDDAVFEDGEAIRFYGWAFDGTREEKQYVTNNVFWLSAEGNGVRIPTVEQVHGERVERVSAEITHEPENIFSLTYTRFWPEFENEFDAWYWTQLQKDATSPASIALPIDIPNPSVNGTATYLIETLDRTRRDTHIMEPAMNGVVTEIEQWDSRVGAYSNSVNRNVTRAISQTALIDGTNWLTLTLQSEGGDSVYINRVTVNYERELVAQEGELQFGFADAGAHTFVISDVNPTADSQFWDISNPFQPQIISTTAPISTSYEIGVDHVENARFLLTDSILQPISLSVYEDQSLTPAQGAEWVAIAHGSLLTETHRLAQWRESHGRLSTHVVDVEDIFVQYGDGFEFPHAIQAYLQDAMTSWETPPAYVILVGDASMNPRQLSCGGSCSSDWTTEDESLVPTFLQPLDRYMGLIPVDHFFTTLVGDDDLPDVAFGRLPVQHSAELTPLINKIITYEQNLVNPSDWASDILFVADDTDGAGNFCYNASVTAGEWPEQFDSELLCLDLIDDADEMRTQMFDRMNSGVLITQYLGHGFIGGWADEDLLTTDDMPLLQNQDKPFVQISGNCLDGNFAWVGTTNISEAMLHHDMGGTAAHWGAPGLGFLFEHFVLHEGFLKGVNEANQTRIGDAIRYAKNEYLVKGWYYAPQAYGSTLLGDPAMQLFHAELGVEQSAETSTLTVGDTMTVEVSIKNRGLLSSKMNVSITVPEGVKLIDVFSPALSSTNTRTANAALSGAIEAGQEVTSTVVFKVLNTDLVGSAISLQTTVESNGFEGDLGDNSAETSIEVVPVNPTAIQLHSLEAKNTNTLWLTFFTLMLVFATVAIPISSWGSSLSVNK